MGPHVFSFEKLTVYQRALQFSLDIYQLTHHWPKNISTALLISYEELLYLYLSISPKVT